MSGLVNLHHQHLILTVSGAKPTIPNPVTATPDDTTWVAATDILRGELAYNTTDKIWYTRTSADAIVEINPERKGYKLLSNGANSIVFSIPFEDDNYFILQSVEFGGTPEGWLTITNKTANGFTVTGYHASEFYYLAKHL